MQKPSGTIIRSFPATARDDLHRLITASNRYDGVDFPFSIDELPSSLKELPTTLLYYADQTLLGFTCVYDWSGIELYGVVHPERRHQGVGRTLLDAAKEIARHQGHKKVQIGCYGSISSGEAFAIASGGTFDYAEYHMELDVSKIQRPSSVHTDLTLRRAKETEAEQVASLIAQAFEDPEEEIRAWITKDIVKPQRRIFFVQLQEETIGTVRLVEGVSGLVDITAFGILQPYRGRGYGKQALLHVVDMLLAENHHQIALDVVTENSRALALYHKCGFRKIRKDSYYKIEF